MSTSPFSNHYSEKPAGSSFQRQRGEGDYADDDEHSRMTEASINSFLEEEGVSANSGIGVEDITAALLTLGSTLSTSLLFFLGKVALLRLDCLTAVEGELCKEAAHTSSSEASAAVDEPRLQRSTRTGLLGWLTHLYDEDKSVSGFFRGGKAELGFVLVTFVEEVLLVAAMRSLVQRLDPLLPNQGGGGESAAGSRWVRLSRRVAPMLVMSLLSRPLRAVRMTVLVNYMADTSVPACKPRQLAQHEKEELHRRRPRRYTSATHVWRCVYPRMGMRSLLLNGLDVDLASRALSLGLAWTAVQPVSQWMRQVAMITADPAGASSWPWLVRLGQHRLFTLGVLMAVTGSVNALQRPFIVLRQRMSLLPVEDAEGVCNASEYDANIRPTARRGCRYANGWDCAVQVWRTEGVAGLFAGLPLCLMTSTVLPLLQTFSGYPTAPSFSGSVV
ncbi:hypothetical protein JKF63_06744 [Porcisia hertigi]|uniref:Mitochondrial carrier protein n=1 Tax=Porcisia hertigi TaxID=2761500 RepID=A0A836LEV1_9TRYP|nr:hypothetical protein JKF63_06744 [Porcisia hertigi]